jgi:hypothetical protein
MKSNGAIKTNLAMAALLAIAEIILLTLNNKKIQKSGFVLFEMVGAKKTQN